MLPSAPHRGRGALLRAEIGIILQGGTRHWTTVHLQRSTRGDPMKEQNHVLESVEGMRVGLDDAAAERAVLARQLPKHTIALVLAGGRGSRLMDLTDRRAKP